MNGKLIKFNLKQLIADKAFAEGRVITIKEIAEEIGVSRVTLSKVANSRGHVSVKSEYIEKLCRYFDCTPNDLMTLLPDPDEGDGQVPDKSSSDQKKTPPSDN